MVADALGLKRLKTNVADSIAHGTTELVREVVQDAMKRMRHSYRTTLTVSDIELSLKAKNLEVCSILSFLSLSKCAPSL